MEHNAIEALYSTGHEAASSLGEGRMPATLGISLSRDIRARVNIIWTLQFFHSNGFDVDEERPPLKAQRSALWMIDVAGNGR